MRTVGLVGVMAMAAALVYGFTAGEFGAEGRALLDLAWGRVTLVDLYTGLFLIGAWIWWRERSAARALPWLAGLIVLGSLAAAVYVLVAARRVGTVEEALTRRR